MSYVLGIDLGTSSLKGSLFNESGILIDSISSTYPIINPEKGYSEQNPMDWINALEDILQKFEQRVLDFNKELSGISFSGQMHSLVLLDKNNETIRNSILWNDVRTTQQCNEIMNIFGDRLLEITQNIALEGFTLPKILWVQKHEPELWKKVDKILLPKDFLGLYMTGKFYTDFTDAAGTLLLDLKSKEWSNEICEQFHIPKNFLPPIYESTDCIGEVRSELLEKFNLYNKVQVFAGAADNACGAIGAGIYTRDKSMVSIGTSGVFLSFEENTNKNYEGKLHYFNHVIKDKYYSMGVTLSAGNSLNWFKRTFAPETSFEELLKNISKIEPGSDGLFFTPYISGERTPYIDSEIRGAFEGIDENHDVDHFVRAILEGITYSLKETQEIYEDLSKEHPKTIVSIGGGAKSKEWLQIQADIFNTPILTLDIDQGPSLGAAMIASVGLDWYSDFESCSKDFVKYSNETFPIVENVSLYEQAYRKYKSMYSATKMIMDGKYEEKL